MVDYDLLEIEYLRDAELPQYTFESFEQYHAIEADIGKSKRARTVKASFIVVYSLFNGKLLARTFYIEEYFYQKVLHNICYEVNRQLAGNKYKLHCRLMNSGFGGYGFKVWKGKDNKGWQIAPYNRFHCYGLYNNYSGVDYVYYYQFNNPYIYLSNSKHKYCGVTEDYPGYKSPNELFEYLYKYNKHPQLEMLMKLKLEHLTHNLQGFKWSKKGVAILGVEKWEIPYLSHFKLTEYKTIREYVKRWKLTIPQAKIAYDLKFHSFDLSRRLIRYFDEEAVTVYNYRDYLRYLDLLGLPHENKYLYPKNFHEAHQNQIESYRVKKDSKLNQRIIELSSSLNKYSLENDVYVIRPAASYEELIKEGRELHHCVATYGERMADGKCVIMLIRAKELLDDPLYTLEFKDKKVVQCRGLHNSKPEEQAIEFVRDWAKKNRLECSL